MTLRLLIKESVNNFCMKIIPLGACKTKKSVFWSYLILIHKSDSVISPCVLVIENLFDITENLDV